MEGAADVIYVFVSEDGALRAFTREPEGRNLPRDTQWLPHDQIRMTLSALSKHLVKADLALMRVVMDGYYIDRKSAQILPFPHRSSS